MTHTELLGTLPPARRARLTARSDAAGLRHLALHLGLLGATSAGIALRVPLWPMLLLPQGLLLVFLFTLAHECTHKTPFRSGWLNEVAGHAIAPVLALPFIWFRYFHLAHHKYTGDPVRDPELAGGGRPATRAAWALYLSGWPYWRSNLATLWRNAFGPIRAPYLPARRHRAMRREARVILALYALALASPAVTPLLIWLWLVPVLIGQPFLRAYLLAEHGLCPAADDMLENSRTTFTNRIIRALAWNMPYHAEHHSLPDVPFHQLPALHVEMAAYLKSTAPGYAAFSADYARSLGAR